LAGIDARFISGHELHLRFGGESGKQDLTFQSDDLGSTLSLLDVTDNIVGGRVAIIGQVSDAAGKRVLRGHVDGENYNLVRAPGFARVLSLASLSAIGSMLAGSGIPFTTLRGDFAYSRDRVVLEDPLAYAGAIGVTANGRLELGVKSLDIQGTIVPAYTLNSIIGNVPVLGSLLLGGEGQGLIAATYRATGSVTDPQISVNPLSALTPGFLRRLLQPSSGPRRRPGWLPEHSDSGCAHERVALAAGALWVSTLTAANGNFRCHVAVSRTARPRAKTTKITLFAVECSRWQHIAACFFNNLREEFVTYRNNGNLQPINEFARPYQSKNNGKNAACEVLAKPRE
jgi:hypothetical protein